MILIMIKIDWGIHSSLLSTSLNKIANKKKKNANFSIVDETETASEHPQINITEATTPASMNPLSAISHNETEPTQAAKQEIQQNIKIGESLLRELQNIQENLLFNSLSLDDLENAAKQLNILANAHLDQTPPPLLNILNDINVRISVELAKYKK